MRTGLRYLTIVIALVVNFVGSISSAVSTERPHVSRVGDNLVADPGISSKVDWFLFGDAEFDLSQSHSNDHSGSVLLMTPIPQGSKVFSDFIPIQGGKHYTFGFFMKTKNGPTYVGAQISAHGANKEYLRNLPGTSGGTSKDGQWQEFVHSVFVPEGVTFVRLQAYKVENTQPGGQIWIDDFYLGTGLGLKRPPASKRRFSGSLVRVDSLGNFEVNKKGKWSSFFPLAMYSSNNRNWRVYSEQGWNTIIWASAASEVKRARAAVSEHNPEGMMAGFQIAPYTMPDGWAYNKLDDLDATLNEIFSQGLGDSLLLYYWDNEVHHEQWQVPAQVVEKIIDIDTDEFGTRSRPLYALQGSFNLARVHAARGWVNVSGTYVGGEADAEGQAGLDDVDALVFLDSLEGQVSPAAFAQFNSVNGPGDMRLRLYNALIVGAKGIGYWRDCFSEACQQDHPSVGPVDTKAWWPDFPHLRREVDRLLPLIRTPHWTDWQASIDKPDQVRLGTRELNGDRYLILVNQTSRLQDVVISGLPAGSTKVRDFFKPGVPLPIRNGRLNVQLPAIGINSGTLVLRITH